MERQRVEFRDLGLMEYKEAWDYQEELLKRNLEIKKKSRFEITAEYGSAGPELPEPVAHKPLDTRHYLLFVEHPPVYTLGKSGDINHVLIGEQEREARGIGFFHTNRGGDITFHGPEQVVGYPIL